MYESYFGLTTKPFELVPNPRFLFLSSSHKKALSYLKYGIQERAGFILLTGEVGSGKTTIIKDIVHDLDRDVILSLVFNTCVNGEQLIALINEDFGLDVKGKGKVELLRDLNDFLVAKAAEDIRPILIVDEAQNLSQEALEEIRLLSNLEAESFKLIQIVLVGQPELRKVIHKAELRQLRQRISIHCHLEPLSRAESEEYVYHRLETAGNRNALAWGPGTFDALFTYSEGIPRLINVFCDFVLLAAFVEGIRALTMEMVEEVIGDVAWTFPEVAEVEAPSPITNHPLPPLDSIMQRLDGLEEKLSQLDMVHLGKEKLSERLAAQENMLKTVVERQDDNSRRLDESLKLIAEALREMKKAEPIGYPGRAKELPVSPDLVKKGVWERIFG